MRKNMETFFLRMASSKIIIFIIFMIIAFLFCEYIMYYLQFHFFCKWPSGSTNDSKKILVLSDTHLLGAVKGHWFDKLRREWQMYRSFQSSIELFSPEFVFILGDIFDEGQWAKIEDFENDVQRFYYYFYVPESIKLYVIAGNHDIGFHYRTHPILYSRFDLAMNTSSVDTFNLNKNILVIRINSIALENDGCSLCKDAQNRIKMIARQIAQNIPSQIIILTHFPLYRPSEFLCSNDIDSFPKEQIQKHREGLDCLSREASDFLLEMLKPNLILNGHVHYSCKRERKIENFYKKIIRSEEITVSSFNWRNRNNPSFLLLKVDSENHWIERCFIPNENLVLAIYFFAFLVSFTLYFF